MVSTRIAEEFSADDRKLFLKALTCYQQLSLVMRQKCVHTPSMHTAHLHTAWELTPLKLLTASRGTMLKQRN